MGSRVIERDQTELQGLPPWARATVKLGAPTVIAIYLVWWLTSSVSVAIDAHAFESRTTNEHLSRLLTQICSNTATTPEERAACWSVRP